MKSLRVLICSALMMGAVSATAYSSPHHGGGAFGGEPSLARVVENLELSESQRASIRSLMDASKAERNAMRSEHREVMQASMRTLPDDPNYVALVEKRKQLTSQAIQQRSDLNSQIYAVLTPEQKAKVPQLLEESRSKMKERRRGMGRRRAQTDL
jgi:periplasmic protein CpxP/Spy